MQKKCTKCIKLNWKNTIPYMFFYLEEEDIKISTNDLEWLN